MANTINYYDLPGTDKICPILSVNRIKWDAQVVECIGKKCQWWWHCNPSLTITTDCAWKG